MAYPEPIPRLTSSQTKEFRENLQAFKLTREQRKMFQSILQDLNKHNKETSSSE